MLKQGLKTLYSIGYYGPMILLTVLILIIIKTELTNLTTVTNHILYIILMNAFASELNGVLKKVIKQPRPKNPIKINRHDVRHSKSYGMPSGHAQLVVTNLVYLSLFAKNNIISALRMSNAHTFTISMWIHSWLHNWLYIFQGILMYI